MYYSRAVPCLLVGSFLVGCGDSDLGYGASGTTADGADAGSDVTPARYAVRVKVALTDDGQGVNLIAPNGSTVHVPPADIIGKTAYWAITPGGEPVSGAAPIEFGAAVMGDDLTTEATTLAAYEGGPWEVSLFISVTAGELINGPQPGDLAAFDNAPPPEGEPPVTGSSVRVRVQEADAEVTLDNGNFIQF